MRVHLVILDSHSGLTYLCGRLLLDSFSIEEHRDACLHNTTAACTLTEHADISSTLLIHLNRSLEIVHVPSPRSSLPAPLPTVLIAFHRDPIFVDRFNVIGYKGALGYDCVLAYQGHKSETSLRVVSPERNSV